MGFITQAVSVLAILVGIGVIVVVALQKSRTEGLGAVLAGGGGGGGKVGRERHLDDLSRYLAYTWLVLVSLAAWLKH